MVRSSVSLVRVIIYFVFWSSISRAKSVRTFAFGVYVAALFSPLYYIHGRSIFGGEWPRSHPLGTHLLGYCPHHPTGELRKNMEASGDLVPDLNCDCHHIVLGVGKRVKDPSNPQGPKIQTQNAIMARARLHRFGIGINDPANGVYLPKSMKVVPHWRFPKALPHRNVHTLAYEKLVNDTLRPLRSADAVRSGLMRLRAMLEHGSDYSFLTKKATTQYEAKMNKLFSESAAA